MYSLPITEIAQLYEDGDTIYTLAKIYGVGRMTILRRLRAAGVKIRKVGVLLGSHRAGGPLFGDSAGYLQTTDRNNKTCRIHRACWEAYNGLIPKGFDIHHINNDKIDNCIENLDCMLRSKHGKLHGRNKGVE